LNWCERQIKHGYSLFSTKSFLVERSVNINIVVKHYSSKGCLKALLN